MIWEINLIVWSYLNRHYSSTFLKSLLCFSGNVHWYFPFKKCVICRPFCFLNLWCFDSSFLVCHLIYWSRSNLGFTFSLEWDLNQFQQFFCSQCSDQQHVPIFGLHLFSICFVVCFVGLFCRCTQLSFGGMLVICRVTSKFL